MIGFIIESVDFCLMKYVSDLVKGFEILIVYVNVDDLEVCLVVVYFVYEYCRCFNKDFLIDLIGYC